MDGDAESWEVHVESARFRAGPATVVRLWSLSRQAPGEPARVELTKHVQRARAALQHRAGGESLWELLDAAVEQALLPRSATLAGVDLRVSLPGSRRAHAASLDHIQLRHDARASTVELTSAASSPSEATAETLVDYARREASAELSLRGMGLADPPVAGSAVTDGRIEGRLSVHTDTGASYDVEGRIRTDRVRFELPALAPGPIGPMELDYAFDLRFAPHATTRLARTVPPQLSAPVPPRGVVEIHESELRVNGAPIRFSGKLAGFDGLLAVTRRLGGKTEPSGPTNAPPQNGLSALPHRVEAEIALPETALQELVNAVPATLLGPLSTAEVGGTLSWDMSLQFSRAAVGDATWSANTHLSDFEVTDIPPSRNPYRLNGAFLHTITDDSLDFTRHVIIPPAQGEETVESGAGRPDARADRGSPAASTRAAASEPADPEYTYVRLEDMSRWVAGAVLSAEDGDFYYHDGVNFRTLPQAIERNIRAGEIRYGASTITMQLAKMLFLEQERVFSRKLQEVILVYLMEHEVPVSKDRILELYLNLAEFGPGIFGIHDAADYYFDKAPAELDAGEATWLASILPSPKRYHQYYEHGRISDGWFVRMKSYLDIMLERDRLTEAEYQAAVAGPPTFAR
ncbi:MAG: transglycosylase domain-containing protein [Spirochaetota bacterium]